VTSLVRFRSPLHEPRTAALLGIALGVSFVVCFVTGVLSHLIQNPSSWFWWPPRPAGLYRFTQGLHVATGLATIPLLFAKLWVVFPKLFEWPPVRSVAHAVERLMLLPLIGASLLLLFTGVANVNIWRPWSFNFRAGHYAAAWIVMGALVIHVTAKWAVTRAQLFASSRDGASLEPPGTDAAEPGSLGRRQFLAVVFATSTLITAVTVGQTVEPLRRLALLAPRRPDVGPQGFPVNRTARSVGLTDVDLATYRLVVDGPGAAQRVELTYAQLRAMPQREATLPIACVEGWSTTQRWRGVSLADVLALAGAGSGAETDVIALHDNPRQRRSSVDAAQARDRDTLLALEVNGEALSPDHGFPVRLIGPNRPGVHQTKWVGQIEVR
jgi:DMSO/TMAO reductase YedYZ molybdopterin-dependent catalytic subunit